MGFRERKAAVRKEYERTGVSTSVTPSTSRDTPSRTSQDTPIAAQGLTRGVPDPLANVNAALAAPKTINAPGTKAGYNLPSSDSFAKSLSTPTDFQNVLAQNSTMQSTPTSPTSPTSSGTSEIPGWNQDLLNKLARSMPEQFYFDETGKAIPKNPMGLMDLLGIGATGSLGIGTGQLGGIAKGIQGVGDFFGGLGKSGKMSMRGYAENYNTLDEISQAKLYDDMIAKGIRTGNIEKGGANFGKLMGAFDQADQAVLKVAVKDVEKIALKYSKVGAKVAEGKLLTREVTEAAQGYTQKAFKSFYNKVEYKAALNVAVNTRTAQLTQKGFFGAISKYTKNPLVVAGVWLSTVVAASAATKAWSSWGSAEAVTDSLGMARLSISKIKTPEADALRAEIESLEDDILNPNIVKEFMTWIPAIGVIVGGSADKTRAGVMAKRAINYATNYEPTPEELAKTPFIIQLQESLRISVEAKAKDREAFQKQMDANAAKKDADFEKKQEAYDKRQVDYQAQQDKMMANWNNYQDQKAADNLAYIDAQWELYLKKQEEYKKQQELNRQYYEERTPSNLKFGLL